MKFALLLSGLCAAAVARAASPAVDWAKQEFAEFSARVFGKAVPADFVLPGESEDFAADFKALENTDGYAVRMRDGRLTFVADNPKGLVNGVHRWLERNTDIVWPRPKGDLCFCSPKSFESVSGLQNDYIDIPVFRMRYFGGASGDTEVWRYLVRNATSCMYGESGKPSALDAEAERYGCRGAFCDMTTQGHDMERKWFPRKEFFKDHPEYWMLIDGVRWTGKDSNFCETNPDFVRAFCKSVEEKISGLPKTVRIISINMEDTRRTCQCADCLRPIKLDDGAVVGPDDPAFASTRFFRFFNKVAEHVNKVRPGTVVLQFAYLHLAVPPKVAIAPNLELKFCPYPRNMREPIFGGPSNVDWQKRVEDWLKLTPNIYWREYYFCGCVHYPRPMADTAAIDLREVAKRGVKDVYTDSPCRNGDNDKLMRGYGLNRMNREYFDMNAVESWVIQRLFWDPSQDPAALRADFIRRTFGPAAADIGEFYLLLNESWYSDDKPSKFWDMPVQSAAHYIVSKGITAKCRAALKAAEGKADHAARHEWISNMRRVLDDWVADASTFVATDFDVPESEKAADAAVLPALRPIKAKSFQDASGSRFAICSDGKALVVKLDAKVKCLPRRKPLQASEERLPDGDKAELFFETADGYVHLAFDENARKFDAKGLDIGWNGAWTVKTGRTPSGWTAEAVIPFDTIGFEPHKNPRLKFLPVLTLTDGGVLHAYSWTGGIPHTRSTWGSLRVNIK